MQKLNDPEVLTENQNYRWYVKTIDTAGNVRSVGPNWFSLAGIYGPGDDEWTGGDNAYGASAQTFPVQNAKLLTAPKAFTWTAVLDPGGVEYRYEISFHRFCNPIYTSSWEALTATLDVPEIGQAFSNVPLNENQWYHWRVSAKDSGGNESHTTSRKFEVIPQPIKYDLAVYDIDQSGNVDLTGPRRYERLGLLRTSAMPAGEVSHVMDSNQALPGAGDYQWCVTARDHAGNTKTSGVCLNFTLADSFGPLAAAPVYPMNGHSAINKRLGFLDRWF